MRKRKKRKRRRKRKKKNIFYGVKTKKGRLKNTLRNQVTYVFFFYTTEQKKADPYIRDIHWYDIKEKMIRSKDFDQTRGYLLHGPYEKVIDDKLIEEGHFYFGKKHGTWLSFNDKHVLQDKLHFSEGWPKDSRVSYYNRDENKIEKLTPIEYDLKEGNFFHFYEDGQIAVTGEYRYGEKVGLWTEYWDSKSKTIRKREVQYQEVPFSKGFRPYIRAEWDKEGNLIYRKDGLGSN
jgi:antitoxin component YwqK of YwqJK toxin-antitoxin module